MQLLRFGFYPILIGVISYGGRNIHLVEACIDDTGNIPVVDGTMDIGLTFCPGNLENQY